MQQDCKKKRRAKRANFRLLRNYGTKHMDNDIQSKGRPLIITIFQGNQKKRGQTHNFLHSRESGTLSRC